MVFTIQSASIWTGRVVLLGDFEFGLLDAGYLMLDDEENTIGEIHNHPVSRNHNPGSVNTGAGFHCSG